MTTIIDLSVPEPPVLKMVYRRGMDLVKTLKLASGEWSEAPYVEFEHGEKIHATLSDDRLTAAFAVPASFFQSVRSREKVALRDSRRLLATGTFTVAADYRHFEGAALLPDGESAITVDDSGALKITVVYSGGDGTSGTPTQVPSLAWSGDQLVVNGTPGPHLTGPAGKDGAAVTAVAIMDGPQKDLPYQETTTSEFYIADPFTGDVSGPLDSDVPVGSRVVAASFESYSPNWVQLSSGDVVDLPVDYSSGYAVSSFGELIYDTLPHEVQETVGPKLLQFSFSDGSTKSVEAPHDGKDGATGADGVGIVFIGFTPAQVITPYSFQITSTMVYFGGTEQEDQALAPYLGRTVVAGSILGDASPWLQLDDGTRVELSTGEVTYEMVGGDWGAGQLQQSPVPTTTPPQFSFLMTNDTLMQVDATPIIDGVKSQVQAEVDALTQRVAALESK